MSERTPDIGRTKYSIMPLVSGWLTSKRYSSPSHTRSTPACSCVAITTRVASTSACSEGAAASQSGTGYEPTTVVRMRGDAIARNYNSPHGRYSEELRRRRRAGRLHDRAVPRARTRALAPRRRPHRPRRGRQDGPDARSHGETRRAGKARHRRGALHGKEPEKQAGRLRGGMHRLR